MGDTLIRIRRKIPLYFPPMVDNFHINSPLVVLYSQSPGLGFSAQRRTGPIKNKELIQNRFCSIHSHKTLMATFRGI